jgi:hypothetical protein
MKLKKYHLIFGVITVILCITTLSQAQALEPDETMLIAPANPALAGIKVLNVVIAIRSTPAIAGFATAGHPTEPSPTGDAQRRKSGPSTPLGMVSLSNHLDSKSLMLQRYKDRLVGHNLCNYKYLHVR